jgi:sarcosine oxidase, subunit gamma
MADADLREVPPVAQVNVRVDPTSAVADRVCTALGVRLPTIPNTTITNRDRTVLWLGPDEFLVVGPAGAATQIETQVRQAFAPDWGSVVDVSANRTVLELRGAGARRVLSQCCPLDLHPREFAVGACAQSLLARTQIVLWHRDGTPAYWIFVRASYAVYLRAWLRRAVAASDDDSMSS